ncbi:MAG: hypothetical protein HYZ58_06530 [Acidobacteria bacterium]|nr:hypothetical protein [Acidobacteriota bacterium]
MADTDRFFASPPIDEYRLEDAQEYGQRVLRLTFPSAVVTPHSDNNTVHARYFPSGRRAGRSRRAVLVLPQWNAGEDGHVGLCRLLNRFGMSALRLSLPYHDRRMPPELHRADYIVSSNVVRTVQVCRQAVVDARRALRWCLSLLTAAHEPLVSTQALNHISPSRRTSPTWSGEGFRRPTCAQVWKKRSISIGCGPSGCRSARGRIWIASAERRPSSSTRATT